MCRIFSNKGGLKLYNLELGIKPKWIIVFGIVLGVFLGGLIIFAGYETDQDLFLTGVLVMIIAVVASVVIYFLIKRAVKEVNNDFGIDLEGFMDMDRGSVTSGIAEVVSVESTGEYVNNNPEYNLILKITVPGQDSFEVEHKQAFNDENLVSIGAKIPVTFDKNRNVQLIGIGGTSQYKVIDPKDFLK